MRHINRRCSTNDGNLHQMLNRCFFSALPKASEDLLSVCRETGTAFHIAGPQQWNPRRPMLVLVLGTNSWPPTADQQRQNGAVDIPVVCRQGCRRQPDKMALSRSGTCGPTSPPCTRYAWLQVANANYAIQAWCGQISMFLTPDTPLHSGWTAVA